MFTKHKTPLLFIFLLFFLPAIAFAWGESFSSDFSTGSDPSGTTIPTSPSSFQTVSSYSGSYDSADYSTAQTFTIPESFQVIISKFDISQAIVPSEAVIQQGLQESLDFLTYSPLQGNDYKAAIIQPIMNLLLSGDYSETTRDLCFSNLLSIASNERINYSQKSTMAEQLIDYMEKEVTAVKNGMLNTEDVTNDMSTIDDILQSLFWDKNITSQEQASIFTAIVTNETLFQESEVRNSVVNIKADLYQLLVSDKDYSISIVDISNKDRGKLALVHTLEKGLEKNTNPTYNTNTVSSFNALIKDTNVPASEIQTIRNLTIFVLENRAEQDYDLKTVCLTTLMNLSQDTRLSDTDRDQIKELITTYALNEYNSEFYENTGVLLLAKDSNDYNSKAAQVVISTVSSISQENRPIFISLEKQLTSKGMLGSVVETNTLHGIYCTVNDIIAIKVSDTYTAENYKSTVLHEATHYKENNNLSAEQKATLQSIWTEANDSDDFVNTLGQENVSEYLATTAEAVLMEYNNTDQPLLTRAQQQAAAGDPTLLKIYDFAKEIWDLS